MRNKWILFVLVLSVVVMSGELAAAQQTRMQSEEVTATEAATAAATAATATVEREQLRSLLKSFRTGSDTANVEARQQLQESIRSLAARRTKLNSEHAARLQALTEQSSEQMEEWQRARLAQLAQLRLRRQEVQAQKQTLTAEEKAERIANIEELTAKVSRRLETANVRLAALVNKIQTRIDAITDETTKLDLSGQLADTVVDQEAAAAAILAAQTALAEIADADDKAAAAAAASEATQAALTILIDLRDTLKTIVSNIP